MNVAAPFLCPYSIKPSRDDGERGVLAVTAFKVAGREMQLHQESAAPGRSRATRREPLLRAQNGISTEKRTSVRKRSQLTPSGRLMPKADLLPVAVQHPIAGGPLERIEGRNQMPALASTRIRCPSKSHTSNRTGEADSRNRDHKRR